MPKWHLRLVREFVSCCLLVALGCASSVPETKYLPNEAPNVSPFFSNGQPLAALQTDEAFLLLSLEPAVLGDANYMRMWLLYRNTSDTPYLLEPLKFATLTTTQISNQKSAAVLPESPTAILADISNEAAAALIVQAVGGALQAATVQPTRTSTHGTVQSNSGTAQFLATTEANDLAEKRARALDRTSEALTSTSAWYDFYTTSLNQGILRRNTVFPKQSVNGYIYFPLPDGAVRWRDRGGRYFQSKRYMHDIECRLLSGARVVRFLPIEGE